MTLNCTLICLSLALMASATQAATIETEQLSQTVKVLASDEFEGRAPGGAGEEKTVAYLISRFENLGLQPGGENGGWTQAVPLIHTLFEEPVNLSLMVGGLEKSLVQATDIEVGTIHAVEQINIDKAPRYSWGLVLVHPNGNGMILVIWTWLVRLRCFLSMTLILPLVRMKS